MDLAVPVLLAFSPSLPLSGFLVGKAPGPATQNDICNATERVIRKRLLTTFK